MPQWTSKNYKITIYDSQKAIEDWKIFVRKDSGVNLKRFSLAKDGRAGASVRIMTTSLETH